MTITRDDQGFWVEDAGRKVSGPHTRKALARYWLEKLEAEKPAPEPRRPPVKQPE